jgi:hypothetical protein
MHFILYLGRLRQFGRSASADTLRAARREKESSGEPFSGEAHPFVHLPSTVGSHARREGRRQPGSHRHTVRAQPHPCSMPSVSHPRGCRSRREKDAAGSLRWGGGGWGSQLCSATTVACLRRSPQGSQLASTELASASRSIGGVGSAPPVLGKEEEAHAAVRRWRGSLPYVNAPSCASVVASLSHTPPSRSRTHCTALQAWGGGVHGGADECR